MPTPKEAELWPPPSKSMTDENVNKLKEGIRMLNDLQTKLAVANGTILDKDIQIKQLEAERTELEEELRESILSRESLGIQLDELRNKVIEECVEKVRYSYNLSLGATDTVVELLNSLKTK